MKGLRVQEIKYIDSLILNSYLIFLLDIFVESFNESTVDPKMNGQKYIDTIIEQVNGADPTSSWREFAEEYIFSEQDIKNGSFRRLTPGFIDVSLRSILYDSI